MKRAAGVIAFVSGLLLLCLGFRMFSFPGFSLIENGVEHKWVTVGCSADTIAGHVQAFSRISTNIITNNIVPFNDTWADASFWIAIYSRVGGTQEFIQVGYHTSGAPMSFWSSTEVGYVMQDMQYLTVGSTHSYALVYSGSAWNVQVDGSTVHTIAWPYAADAVELDMEPQCLVPSDPGMINAGVVTFSAVSVGWRNSNLPFFAVMNVTNGNLTLYWNEDQGNNGLVMSLPQTVEMGWGLPLIAGTGVSPVGPEPVPNVPPDYYLVGAGVILAAIGFFLLI